MLVLQDTEVPTSCTPKTCAQLGGGCGEQGDGCGNLIQCGACTLPETCGGGKVPNMCGAANPDAGDGSSPIPTGTLTLAPLNDSTVVQYGHQTPSVTFTARVGNTPVAASFSIDLG